MLVGYDENAEHVHLMSSKQRESNGTVLAPGHVARCDAQLRALHSTNTISWHQTIGLGHSFASGRQGEVRLAGCIENACSMIGKTILISKIIQKQRGVVLI
ncbi:hypothetical protein M404DRAFT_789090 [Pisolithus tinctorius Marx 270]|uniref:Uncharacterized protein n=1 Tax=Pisolithus tinctorius Marx 270 TaxID=870435 RepID=A0A0C3PR79_PISTI|nr:hypothetical protein M404DRAFT_789090 [Pisolithus tinctorius Marx 270]